MRRRTGKEEQGIEGKKERRKKGEEVIGKKGNDETILWENIKS